MVWACGEVRGNKSSKRGYENKRCREKRRVKTKKRGGWIRSRMI